MLRSGHEFVGRRVTRALQEVVEHRGTPAAIRCNNGPEFTSRHFLSWCEEHKINLLHIQPGKPMQNRHIESFNGRLRDECLNANWFHNLADARHKITAWKDEYNRKRLTNPGQREAAQRWGVRSGRSESLRWDMPGSTACR